MPARILAAVILAAWLAWWDLWGEEFNYKDDGQPVPVALHVWYSIALLVCSAGVMALCATVIRSLVQVRTARTGQHFPTRGDPPRWLADEASSRCRQGRALPNSAFLG